MALQITSVNVSSPSSSFNCIDDLPKLPLSVQMRPSKSSYNNSTNHLLFPLSSYPPMPPSKIHHQYIPTDPLYLPQHQPYWPYQLGEDISRVGAGTRYIGITARELTLTYITLCQDTTLSHYSQPFPPDDALIWRCVMFWWDAWGLGEQCGCCRKKSFYCSKLALLNDDNDDDETFGEYIESPKQLKKNRR